MWTNCLFIQFFFKFILLSQVHFAGSNKVGIIVVQPMQLADIYTHLYAHACQDRVTPLCWSFTSDDRYPPRKPSNPVLCCMYASAEQAYTLKKKNNYHHFINDFPAHTRAPGPAVCLLPRKFARTQQNFVPIIFYVIYFCTQ